MTTVFADPRRRNLAILAAAAVVSVVLAVLALDHRAAVEAPKYPPHEFFPGLAGELNQVSRIHVASKTGAFDIVFKPTKGWVVPGRNNYPASIDEVRKTLVGIAALETMDPKTARPDWYHFVDLDAPPKGNAVIITLANDKGDALATLIAGKTEDIGDASGSVGLFARKPDDAQSWLVRSPFTPRADQTHWLDKDVVNVDRSRIEETDVTPSSGPAYSVSRAKPSDPDFMLDQMPKGRELAYAGSPDTVATAITNFTFDDIKPADGMDFSHAARLVTKTFDGLVVTAEVVKQGADYWCRLAANAQPGKTDAAKEAEAVNTHADGWVFKLDPYKGAAFDATLESLLKPKAKK
ncbi:MAG: DUF4340 domain-containing protein [Alphaproteobacteria bacterium]|nr:DUF4340 domain-containing protein [Alphaproteobacteria bacterium]